MGSLLYRQSSQRILPDESCLLMRAEFRVTSGSTEAKTLDVGVKTKAEKQQDDTQILE